MFATLIGTNTTGRAHEPLFGSLCALAVTRGFAPPDTTLRVQPDQTSLEGWSLSMKGPSNSKADFLLAVTAPKVPSISPIPVRQTVSGPLFAVVVMSTFFGVMCGRDFTEFKESSQVLSAFEAFIGSLARRDAWGRRAGKPRAHPAFRDASTTPDGGMRGHTAGHFPALCSTFRLC